MNLKKGDKVYVEFISDSRTEFSGNLFKGFATLDLVDDRYVFGTTDDNRHFMCNLSDVRHKYVKPKNVLSLYNGISACHLALDRAGVSVNSLYYAEICNYANKVTMEHYPNDISVGDVLNWRDWDIDWSSIDLVTAGFPCQSWSIAGKGLGDKDERGLLFWTTLDIMQHILKHNKDAKFLLENVKMKKDFENYITKHTTKALGSVNKKLINSGLVSAQSRERYYWTNFDFNAPNNLGIKLQDILEVDTDHVWLDCKVKDVIPKHSPSGLLHIANAVGINGNDSIKRIYHASGKAPTLTTMGGGNREPKVFAVIDGLPKYRKITPLECERLQTFPDGWTKSLSKTRRYASIGNAWTVDVLASIFKQLL